MKSMAKKKIGGFMCNSPAATAVCMTPDSRSVVIPGRRSATSERNIIVTSNNCTTANPNPNPNSTTTTDDQNTSKLFHRYSKLPDNYHYYNYNNDKYRRVRGHDQSSSQTKLIISSNNENNNSSNSIVSTTTSTNDQQIIKLGDLKKSSSSVLLSDVPDHNNNNLFQVVVMRVSLHCQGCAGKLKKHLSKMEGVTSFSIELEHKRVTVMGHVSPVVVLENISKVRRAEFWPAPSASADQYHLRHF